MVNSSFSGQMGICAFSGLCTNISLYCNKSDSSFILGKIRLIHTARWMLIYQACASHCRFSTEVWDWTGTLRHVDNVDPYVGSRRITSSWIYIDWSCWHQWWAIISICSMEVQDAGRQRCVDAPPHCWVQELDTKLDKYINWLCLCQWWSWILLNSTWRSYYKNDLRVLS